MCAWGGNGKHIKPFPTLACGGHFRGQRTNTKVLQSGLYWPILFKDAHQFLSTRDKCQ